MDTTKELTHISLCAGYGGIDIGLRRVISNLRTIALSEIEAFACANLVAKMEQGFLDAAPIWTDLRTFPFSDFNGKVGILSGGFPCQPFSSAGKRAGDEDPRHLFPHILKGITQCNPEFVFLENVEGIVSAKLAGTGWRDPAGTPVLLHVLRELERVGYRATAGVFSSAEIGASHQRKRVFILAMANRKYGKQDKRESQDGASNQRSVSGRSKRGTGGESATMADSSDYGHNASEKSGSVGQSQDQGWMLQPEGVGSPQRNVYLRPKPPGRDQWWWEPSRVICKTMGDSSELFSHGGDHYARVGLESGSVPQSGNPSRTIPMADPTVMRMEGQWSEQQATGSVQPSQGTEPVGNPSDEHGSGQGQGHGEEPSGRASSEPRDGATQPPLGGTSYGSPRWMDYARLSATVGSRIDELRLLGNGVDPSVAAKAFVTLYQRLT